MFAPRACASPTTVEGGTRYTSGSFVINLQLICVSSPAFAMAARPVRLQEGQALRHVIQNIIITLQQDAS